MKTQTWNFSSDKELMRREKFFEIFKNCPLPKKEMLRNLALFQNRQTLSRLIFIHEIYKKIINVHGVIMELEYDGGRT